LLGGLVLLSCPTVGLRIIDVSTDIAATFPVIAAVALARVVSSIEAALFIFTALVGLGGSMKQYAVFPAVPIGLALFLPHTMRILRSWRALVAGLAGIAVALLCLASSMLPIYWAYGDISGGDFAFSLSNVGRGWHGIRETLAYNFVQWSFEPLALLPEDLRRSVFTQLSLDKVWAYFGHPGSVNVLLPQVDRERMRGLAYSILFLPWLILAVKKGYRIIALVVFLAIAFAQLAPLAVNLVGARFTIIILAAFSVLWAARAARSPVIVGCIVCLTLNADIYCASRGYPFQLSWPTFQMQHEVNRDLLTAVGDDTVLLLGKAMALDAEIAGRFAQVRFEYANCPADGDWTAHFAALKSQFRWFMMSAPPSEIMPGPYFKTRLGPVCQSVMPTMLKEALSAAGWRYETKVVREYELWTHP
jgi:hypothetical protein